MGLHDHDGAIDGEALRRREARMREAEHQLNKASGRVSMHESAVEFGQFDEPMREEGDIARALTQFDKRLMLIGEAVMVLTDRIAPVLKPEPPSDEENVPRLTGRPEVSDLAMKLYMMEERAASICGAINKLNLRVDL